MIRNNFPTKEGHTHYGYSDGYRFKISFKSESEDETVEMLREFLDENGYDDIPLPKGERLWWDYFRPDEDGVFGEFIWHPIILTHSIYGENSLTLFIHNEKDPKHKELWNSYVKC